VDRCVHILKSLVAVVLVHSGWLRRWHRRRRPHVLVLAYHRVTPDAALAACAYPAMHVSVSTFAAQIEALQGLYRVIPMAALRDIMAQRVPLAEPVAVITFDDGYRDNYQHALPVLARLGVPATFFLSVDFVARGHAFWFDRLARAVDAWDRSTLAAREHVRPALPAPLVAALEAGDGFQARLRAAAAFLKTLPDAERETAVRSFSSWAGDGVGGVEALRWEELQDMRRAGMNIGAHGVHHGILTRMPPQAAGAEIQQAVTAIATELGVPVHEFAYPNGDANEEIARLAAGAGIQLGFTMQPRAVQPGDDPLRLGRRNVCEATSQSAFRAFSRAFFYCEMTGIFDALLGRTWRRH
jgi:peptidoglycan/xylan/chitin deacetylase (PgdA/CDA1 family)